MGRIRALTASGEVAASSARDRAVQSEGAAPRPPQRRQMRADAETLPEVVRERAHVEPGRAASHAKPSASRAVAAAGAPSVVDGHVTGSGSEASSGDRPDLARRASS